MVIYVDVLFVVNFFITYLLLISTSFFAKSEIKQYRAV
ncbi:MAG: sigma-E processing peptidase SpoIIGA, partial [Clostridiales bacterium]